MSDEELILVKKIIEALLFSVQEPLPVSKIGHVLEGEFELSHSQIKEILKSLERELSFEGRGFRLEETAKGFRFRTDPIYYPYLQRLKPKLAPDRISVAASEVLAIVAYRQPVTKIELEQIRGVDCNSHITHLMERGLVEVVGRKEMPGRPALYGTTKKFLLHFGLKNLKELPRV